MVTKKQILSLLRKILPSPLSAIDGESTFNLVVYYILYALVVIGLSLLLWFLPSCTVTFSVQKNNNNSTQSSESSSSSSVDSTTIFQPQTFK